MISKFRRSPRVAEEDLEEESSGAPDAESKELESTTGRGTLVKGAVVFVVLFAVLWWVLSRQDDSSA
ncbi:MAG: hypothetical protein ACLFNI_03170 [Natronomonas sp.]